MTDPLYDSRNPNHGRAGGLRDPEPRLSADIVDRLRDRDAIVVGGMFHAIPALKEAADEIERLRDRISAVEAKGVLAPAQGSFNQAKDYVDNAIASFAFDPPDNQFLKGYLAALEVIQAEAFTAQPPAAPVETLDALVEKITPENRHQEVGIECSSAGSEPVVWRVRYCGQWMYFEDKANAEIYAQGDDNTEPLYRAVPQSSGVWQVVETAPKDVEVLMCWEVEWPERRWEYASGLWGSTRGGWNHGQATHWMPLPTPPVTRPT
jgi:hypothetical protein